MVEYHYLFEENIHVYKTGAGKNAGHHATRTGVANMSDRLIITPAESAHLGVEFIKSLHAQRDRLMPLILPGMDNYFMPLLPGELVAVVARTHNGKSWFMNQWSKRMIKHLQTKNRDEAIVWVDTEMTADSLGTSAIARGAGLRMTDVLYSKAGLDMVALMNAARQVSEVPLYTIATRLGSKDGGAEVHLTNIQNGIRDLTKGQVDGQPRKVAAIFVDYLQALPIDPTVRKSAAENQRRLQVSRDVDRLRSMGSIFNCPVIIGVQAKQDLAPTEAQRALGLPTIYDGQETANIAQRPDRIISLSVAPRNFPRGYHIDYHGYTDTVRDGLMFLGVWKQRAAFDALPAGHVFAYEMNDDPDPFRGMKNLWSEWP